MEATSSIAIPRGLSKYYMLSLLKEKPMTGKEITEEISKRTDGSWKPSAELVYPLLGKLLSSGLIEEVDGGGYRTTKSGEEFLLNYGQKRKDLDELFAIFARLGLLGQILAKDAVDGAAGIMKSFRKEIAKLGVVPKTKYRKFLLSEIERLDQAEKKDS